MQKLKKNSKKDVNELAFAMVQAIANGEPMPKTAEGKDPLAVLLGRRGGLKGGPARAAKMTSRQRTESARKAANARWTDRKSTSA